ncbi:MAG: glycosyltransferase [Planctomycetes bacterium]|nr:glycosyltransferase [Planctomycetota bacterium]
MNIVQLTPGTGNFHCGNCVRDNALVHALRRMGHDVLMVPLYLPQVVDEEPAAGDTPIFFGGINVYLEQKIPLFRHTPRWVDHLFASPALLTWAANRAGMTSARDLGELTVSMLKGEQGLQNKELTRLIDFVKTRHHVNVVKLSNAMLIGMARRIRRETGAKVVCTLAGEDAFLDSLVEPYREQAWNLMRERAKDVDAFIAVSRYYGEVMTRRMDLDPDKVHVVHNGIDTRGYEVADTPPNPPALGYFARLCKAKGLDTLVDAYIALRKRDRVGPVKLKLAGAMTHDDRPFVDMQRKKLADAGFIDDVQISVNVDHAGKQAFLRSLSVMSVPATYGESFGLYVLEALASGVPIVQPRHGAFVELLEQLGGGILCEPDNVDALADAIEILLLREEESRAMAASARQRVLADFTVERMAGQVMDVLESLSAQRAGALS